MAQGLSAGSNGRPVDDPDGDGISNLLKFILDGAPDDSLEDDFTHTITGGE